jgi:hypothetical protein
LFAAEAGTPDCSRVRFGSELQSCEIARDEHDVLDSAGRPPATALGRDAVRFSMQPSLGGRAIVVEVVSRGDGGATGRLYWFDGHPRLGWTPEGSARFSLSLRNYRRLATVVDRLIGTYRDERREEGEGDDDGDKAIVVCTDGPEQVTERVREGRVATLSGFCPSTGPEPHPNASVAAVMLSLACPYVLADEPGDRLLRNNCRRWRAVARREGAAAT